MSYNRPTSLEQGIIWVGCIIGSLSSIDFTRDHQTPIFILLNAVIFLFILHASFYTLQKIKILESFQQNGFLQKLFPALLGGIFVGLSIFLIKVPIIIPHTPTLWSRILIIIHGAFNDEVINRLFILPLILSMLIKVFKNKKIDYSNLIWSAIIITPLVSSFLVIPLLYFLPEISSHTTMQLFLLNLIQGVTSGWLFWKKGFWTASLAHLISGIIQTSLLINPIILISQKITM